MRSRVALFGTAGILATSLGALLLFVPDLVLGVGPLGGLVERLSGTDPKMLALGSGLLAALYLGLAARPRSDPETAAPPSPAEARFEMAATAPPEAVTAERQAVAAESVDEDVSRAVSEGEDALREVRSQLRLTATSAYADVAAVPPGQARDRIDRGEWTRDPVAATFLAGSEGPDPSLRMRLRRWLVPARERRRRIERTIGAIETMQAQA